MFDSKRVGNRGVEVDLGGLKQVIFFVEVAVGNGRAWNTLFWKCLLGIFFGCSFNQFVQRGDFFKCI